MKKTLLASTFAVLAQVPTLGHTDDLAQVQAQFEIMTQRMDKLEQRNGELQQENETLQKALAANAVRSGAESKPDLKTDPKLDSWVSRLDVQGDVRYRKEVTDTDADSSVRDRDVLRARLGLDARVNDSVRLGIGLTTGENGNPRGANQTLDGEFSRKSLDLDLAYVDWAFGNSLHAIAGKM
jgi:regulator of replication initiation timing